MPHVPARLQPYGNTRCRHKNTKITNHAQLLGVARLQMEEGEEEEREGRVDRDCPDRGGLVSDIYSYAKYTK